MTNLYLDLDGVFADFDKAFHEQTGNMPYEVSDDELWRHINDRPTFFADLPAFEGTLEFFHWALRGIGRPIIITACPQTHYVRVAQQKKAWVERHLMPGLLVLPVRGGPNKALFMQRPGDVLVDDFKKNCDAWTAAGGWAIQHKDFNTTKQELKDAFS